MKKIGKYDISFFGEFVDKSMETEFINYDMKRYVRFIGPVALVFGIIYMLFIVSDYFAIKNPFSFSIILVTRIVVLAISVILYLTVNKIANYTKLTYFITAYESLAIIAFLIIIYQYENLTYLSFFSIMALTLALYITPNRLILTQIISILLCLFFFTFPARNIAGVETPILLRILAYDLILIIYCNIGAYMTNLYKRRQFADSKELLRLSVIDPLTGIYNRAKFDEELNRWISYCNRYEDPLCLIIFDIDNFKRINDTFGHIIGDVVIQNIAATIKNSIRNTDVFARWGGEEFVILLPNTGIQQAMDLAERLRICIQKRKYDKVGNITCSFGLTALKEDDDEQTFMKRVDKFLYEAKSLGKNIVVCEAGIVGKQLNKI